MSGFTIRPLAEADLDSLAALYRLFWNDEQDLSAMKSVFSRLAGDRRHLFLVAEVKLMDHPVVAGTIMGVICEELYGACKPFLVMDDLVVNPDYRRRGIGRGLVRALEEEGRKAGCHQMLFITESSRIDSISFYEKLGFSPNRHKGFKKKL